VRQLKNASAKMERRAVARFGVPDLAGFVDFFAG
jgi:hypothetical protein